MEYGPWGLSSLLYNKNGTSIYATSDTRWVLKIIDAQKSTDELSVILAILKLKPRHCISLPSSLYSLYGRNATSGWYALKRYSGHVTRNEFCKSNWRSLAIDVLQFLQDFHHNQGIAHMDIKKGNILVDEVKSEFIVADYEHAEKPQNTLTRSYDDDYKWYYMAMGAEMDEPLVSWRMDLTALGYLLASLLIELANWTFEQKCWGKRSGIEISEADILSLRSKELSAAHPIILTYMQKVSEVSWSAKDPPTRDFYKQLEKLFHSEL